MTTVEDNLAAARKFVDALNLQDTALLESVCAPDIAKGWIESLPEMYKSMENHHIEIVATVTDINGVAMKMATSGYHTGLLHGLPPTGKKWTNRVFTFFKMVEGKIVDVDALPDAENIIKQIGGKITPVSG